MAIYADKKDGKPTGRWRVEVQKDGKRARGRFDTHAEAVSAEAAWQLEMPEATKEREDKRGAPKRLGDLIERAKGTLWRGKVSGDLQESRLHVVGRLIKFTTPLVAISTSDLDKAVSELLDDDLSPSTVNKYLSSLHKLLEFAHDRKWLNELPVFPWQDEEGGRIRWLTEDEEIRLYELLPPDVAMVVRVAIQTGMRRGELLSLTAGQVEHNQVHLWKTKTKTPRPVPISQDTHAMIMWLLAQGMPSKHVLRYHWDAARKTMGLSDDPWFVFHVTRHTCATRLIRANVNPRVVQKWLGHKRLETTMRYAQVNEEMLHDALARRELHAENFRVQLVDPSPTVGYLAPAPTHQVRAAHKKVVSLQCGRGGTGRRAGFRFRSVPKQSE